MHRLHQPVNFTQQQVRIGDVFFCLRTMNPEITTHPYEMCITSAIDGSYVPVFLNDNNPFYQGVYAFHSAEDYNKISTAMRDSAENLVSTLDALHAHAKKWADTLRYSLPNANHESYRLVLN